MSVNNIMFTTKYNIYDVNVYDLLKRGGGNQFHEYEHYNYQNEYEQPFYQDESFVSVEDTQQTPQQTPKKTPASFLFSK